MPHGGARAGAGRLQQRITLKPQTARVLRELVRRWLAENPEAKYTPSRVVDDLIYGEAIRLGALAPATRAAWVSVERGE